jgi:hypothetical protein
MDRSENDEVREGHGIHTYPNGDTYDGFWFCDREGASDDSDGYPSGGEFLNHECTYTFANKAMFKFTWSRGPYGPLYGTFFLANGDPANGQCTFTLFPGGTAPYTAEGEWKDGQKESTRRC